MSASKTLQFVVFQNFKTSRLEPPNQLDSHERVQQQLVATGTLKLLRELQSEALLALWIARSPGFAHVFSILKGLTSLVTCPTCVLGLLVVCTPTRFPLSVIPLEVFTVPLVGFGRCDVRAPHTQERRLIKRLIEGPDHCGFSGKILFVENRG